MKEVDFNNKEDFDDIYIHDTFFTNIDIDYNNNNIIISLAGNTGRYYSNRQNIIIFKNVIKFDFLKLCLWGDTIIYQILDMYLKKDSIKQYINEKEINDLRIKDIIDRLLTIEILVNSGDTLQIICERVIFLDLSTQEENKIYQELLNKSKDKKTINKAK